MTNPTVATGGEGDEMTDWVGSLPFALATVLALVHITACVLALGVSRGTGSRQRQWPG